MEQLGIGSRGGSGTNLNDMRMLEPPHRKGKSHDDLGASLVSSKLQASRSKHSQSGAASRTLSARSNKETIDLDSDSPSSDEADLLPRKKDRFSKDTRHKSVRQSRREPSDSTPTSSAPNPYQELTKQAHKTSSALKTLSFRKNKPKDLAPQGSKSAITPTTPLEPHQVMVDGDVHDYPKEENPPRSTYALRPSSESRRFPPSKSAQKPFKPPTMIGSPTTGVSSIPSAIVAALDTATRQKMKEGATAASRRNVPERPKVSPHHAQEDDDRDNKNKPNAARPTKRPAPRPRRTPPGASSRPIEVGDDTSESSHSQEIVATKPKPAAFPLDCMSPIKEAAEETPKPKDKGKGKEKLEPAPFPLTSLSSPSSSFSNRPLGFTPTSSATFSEATEPPASSPPPSPTHKNKAAGKTKQRAKRVVMSESEDSETDAASKSKARPFPMATQALESIRASLSPGKRLSEGDDDLEPHPGTRKKRRRGGHEILNELMSEGEDDSMRFLDPNDDPSSLCPWCDEPLPPNPSPLLRSLIQNASQRSYPDPRPSNPHGLRAPLTTFAAVCQRHSFECVQVPLAHQRGWPTSIQWDQLAERVRRMKGRLRKIVNDVDEEWLPGRTRREGENDVRPLDDDDETEEDEHLQRKRPRKGSIFWKDVTRNVKREGARKATGVRGQFSSFSKTQPGYYGELGYVIIHQTIYDLFPPESFDADSTLPLTPTEFIQLILVPEAAVALVMEDMQQSRRESIKTLRESAEYGVTMFPDDLLGAGAEAGENIVKARAKARRHILGMDENGLDEQDAVHSSTRTNRGSNHQDNPLSPISIDTSGKEDKALKSAQVPAAEPRRSTRSRKARRRANDLDHSAASGHETDVIMLTDTNTDTCESDATTSSKTSQVRRSKRMLQAKPSSSSMAAADENEQHGPRSQPRRRKTADVDAAEGSDVLVDPGTVSHTDGDGSNSNPSTLTNATNKPRPRPKPRKAPPLDASSSSSSAVQVAEHPEKNTYMDVFGQSDSFNPGPSTSRHVNGHGGGNDVIDLDATPRPRRTFSRANSESSTISTDPGGSRRSRKESVKERFLSRMAETFSDSDEEDGNSTDVSRHSTTSRSSRRGGYNY